MPKTGTEQPGTDDEVVSVVAVDEQIEIAGDLAEPETVTAPGGKEELDWEDVASEIDLQLDEAEGGEKEEEPIEIRTLLMVLTCQRKMMIKRETR